jgi:hypothetical protein
MASAYIVFEYFSYRKAESNKVSTLALVIASNSSAALAFQSDDDANEILNALKADKYITAACLFDVNGNIFAKYPNSIKNSLLPSKPGIGGYSIKGSFIEGFEPVHQEKLHLGTLYIKSSLGGLYNQIKFNILIAMLLIAITLVVGFFLTKTIQKTISDPIISLEKAARNISAGGDYTIRATKSGNDELGSLTDAFNHMLSQIETQNQQIVKNEEHLRLATQSAELGTFDMDLNAGTMMWDRRCRELFGIYHNEKVTYEKEFIKGLHNDDREIILEKIDQAFDKQKSGGLYDVEYRTIGETDKRLRWVKAKGKVFFDDEDKPVRFIGSVLDITKQKQDEIRKNDFIAIISHELKTPLTTIKSYVQILLAKAKKQSDDFATNALTRAEVQANKMSSMIKDFLELAKIEEGKLRLEKDIVIVSELLEEVVSEAKLFGSTHQIDLNYCEGFKINADRDKIIQVLINLISNAIKYSQIGTAVKVGCSLEDNGRVKIFVKDNGVGISLLNQKKLFTRFYRVENEKVKTVSGFGIGLYIVSEILKYHGSQIKVDSTEGEGSTFYFLMEALP